MLQAAPKPTPIETFLSGHVAAAGICHGAEAVAVSYGIQSFFRINALSPPMRKTPANSVAIAL
jgi:hypothetical protein